MENQHPQNPFKEGQVILVDKPYRWTSFDVVNKIRYKIKTKIGHAGTLDPLATGLLICCTGRFTKRITTFQAQEKEYVGTMHLGATTPTYDLESAPSDFKEIQHLTKTTLKETLVPFRGTIEQIPPAHSAVKKNGRKAYELARKGKKVILQPRIVDIKVFEFTRVELPEIDFRVVCSTGTYIRSLIHDYGQALGCGAYLSQLRRTKIGDFSVEDAVNMEHIGEYVTTIFEASK